MAKRGAGGDVDSPEKRKRASTGLREWWSEVCSLPPEAYAAGKVLDLSVPTQLEELRTLRGPDARIKKLYVRRDFDALYMSLQLTGGMETDWLGHISGNSGVGKSAFFWYFIIRTGINMKGFLFQIVYQSGNYMWEFDSSGQASVWKKGDYPEKSLAHATWHLVNQKIEAGDPLGPRVLVAASPERANIKSAKPDRQLSTFYVYPWEEDEFGSLVNLWLEESVAAEKTAAALEALTPRPLEEVTEASKLLSVYAVNSQRTKVGEQDLELLGEELKLESKEVRDSSEFARRLWGVIDGLKRKASDIRRRADAAKLYFSWFGGVVRWLWQLNVNELNEKGFEKRVDDALSITDLAKILQAIRGGAKSDDVSWLLLHFTRPGNGCEDYVLEFASSKVKYKFLAKTKDEDLQTLLDSSNPELGALRGYIFEQEVMGQILSSRLNAVLMVDNRHCQKCNAREDDGPAAVQWIACDRCHRWYHQSCVGITHLLALRDWECPNCQGRKSTPSRGLALRYFEGDLKDALLAAGPEAKLYVWRPLSKNNAAFDFVVLPGMLGQATTADRHEVPFEAVQKGIDALKAWNEAFNQGHEPENYLLTFFLASTNFDAFGYQSYRSKLRRVSNRAVKGVSQAKVLVRTNREKVVEHTCSADIACPPDRVVEKVGDLFDGPATFADLTVPELEALAKSWGMTGYSSLNKEALVSRLEAWAEPCDENREFERRFYLGAYPSMFC